VNANISLHGLVELVLCLIVIVDNPFEILNRLLRKASSFVSLSNCFLANAQSTVLLFENLILSFFLKSDQTFLLFLQLTLFLNVFDLLWIHIYVECTHKADLEVVFTVLIRGGFFLFS
jgi:hypothetical protein